MLKINSIGRLLLHSYHCLIILFFGGEVSGVYAQNPLSPFGVYVADPTARVMSDGRLYIYGSTDLERNVYCSNLYHVLSTSDMQNWQLHKNIFSSMAPNDGVIYSDALLYAPDCIEYNGRYYLFYCLSDGSEGYAIGNTPCSFKPSDSKFPISGIDPAVFIDDDGQAYYYWGQFSASGAKLNNDMITLDLTSIKHGLITEKEHHFHEGSWVFKRNDIYYYVYTAINDRGEATSIDYSISSSPLGPFKYCGTIIDNWGCDPCTWNNHGSIVEYKNQWYIFYHRSTHANQSLRKVCVEKICFNADGTIPKVEMTSQGAGDPLDAFSKIDAARACLLTGKMRIVQSDIDREELARIEHYNTATYKYLNFSKQPSKINVKVAPMAGGRILVLTNSHQVHGIINIPPGNGIYKNYSIDITNIPKGISQVRFRFEGEEDKDLMRFDSFYFE